MEWIIFENFKTILSAKKLPTEPRVHSANVFSWLKNRDGDVRKITKKPAFSVRSVSHYFFAHASQYQFCKQVTDEIKDKVTDPDTYSSVQDIYVAGPDTYMGNISQFHKP